MNNVVQLPAKTCAECGALASEERAFVDDVGKSISKFYCKNHIRDPLDRDQLALLIDTRDEEIGALKRRLTQIATVCTDNMADGCNKTMALGFIRQLAVQTHDTP